MEKQAEPRRERREYKRIPEHIGIKYRQVTIEGEESSGMLRLPTLAGTTQNISEGGMLFESDEALPLGCFLEVQIYIPNVASPLFLKGRVIRLEELVEDRRFDIGIMFTGYFVQDRELLRVHLVENEEKYLPGEGQSQGSD